MKLRYIIASFAAAAAVLFTGCKEEGDTYLNEIRVSSSYIGIPTEGGSVKITVSAQGDWSIDQESIPEWLTINPTSGAAGESEVTLSAGEAEASNKVELLIACLGRTQRIIVTQEAGEVEVKESTCKEIMDGPETKYRVTGVVTRIHGAHYGNMYINDGTVEDPGLQIYGSLDKKGNKMTGSMTYDCFNDPKGHENSWSIAIGDKVTVEGPKTLYNGTTVELVDVTIIAIEKALVSVEPMDIVLDGPEAGETEVSISSKASSLKIVSNDDWLFVKSTEYAGESINVTIGYLANEDIVKRTGTLTVSGEGFNPVTITVTQGANAPALMTIAEALQGSYVHVKGKIMAICNRGYVLSDATGSILIYYGSAFQADNYALGDEIEIIGDISAYNYGPQLSCDGKPGFDLEEKVSSGSGSVTYPTPKILDQEALAALKASIQGKSSSSLSDVITMEYVQIVGTPVKSGNYTNIFLDDYTDADFSAYQLPSNFDLASMLDKKVTIRGYTQSVSGGRHVNIVFTSLEEGAAADPEDYLVASFAEGNEGFTFDDVSLPEGSTYVWKYDASYHYLKASSYFSGASHASESIAVSPAIDLSDASEVYLNFQHVGKNFPSVDGAKSVLSVEVKADGEWHKLTIPTWFTNSDWNFVDCKDIDLSAYAGKSVNIGFRYISTTDNCGTWEVKQVKVCNYTSE